MQVVKKTQFLVALAAGAPAAFAHEAGGWASIHWHTSDFLGLAVVGVLCAGALLLARRLKRASRQK